MTLLRTLRPAAATALCALLAGCVMSIVPAVPASEAVFEPHLLGTWQSSTDTLERAVISTTDSLQYVIEYTDQEGKAGWFEGYVGRIDGHLVLEVRPAAATLRTLDAGDSYTGMLLPAHLVFAVELAPDQLVSRGLDVDSIRSVLRDGRIESPYLDLSESMAGAKDNNDILLTGTTPQVRAMIARALASPEWLTEPKLWHRAVP